MTGDPLFELPAGAFAKQDAGDDLAFYAPPRLVTHIDEDAVAALISKLADAGMEPLLRAERDWPTSSSAAICKDGENTGCSAVVLAASCFPYDSLQNGGVTVDVASTLAVREQTT